MTTDESAYEPLNEYRSVLAQAAAQLDLVDELTALDRQAGEIFKERTKVLERLSATENVVPVNPLDAG